LSNFVIVTEKPGQKPAQTYPLRAAARITGLSPALLRAWERRYHAVEPQRTPGGTRRYSAEDLERLRWLKAAVDAGNRISKVAALDLDALKQRAEVAADEPDDRLAETLHAITRLDAPEVQRLISQQLSLLGPARFAREFALPLTHEIGQRWADERITVASEHLATAVLRSILGSALQPTARSLQGPRVLFATPAGEPHELGLQMAALTALGAGASPVYLGADMPHDALVDAAARTGAHAVALSLITIAEDTAAADVRRIRDALPPATFVWLGGPCARRLAPIEGTEVIETLDAFERRVVLLGYGSSVAG
jgi:DNA-binding transcriptional MerR regulator/methylmalonyl-CoA mutase cobalamin-binding subunit